MKYDVVGFEELRPVRFTPQQMKDMRKIVRKDEDTYENVSTFIRASVIRMIRLEKARLKI